MYTEVHNEKTDWFDAEDSPNRAFAEVSMVFALFVILGYPIPLCSIRLLALFTL
jgi:hypothetical protein